MSQTFDLFPLRFHCRARRDFCLGANNLRGGLGKSLRRLDRAAYDQLFEPRSLDGPSGLRDAPRPFVFRATDRRVVSGERFDFGFHLFDMRESAIEILMRAFGEIGEVESVDGRELLRLPIDSAVQAGRVRVRFVTPTELKGTERPEFGVLFARVRDRVSTLRALYGPGPLDIDFQEMRTRASKVIMTRCEIEYKESERVSRSTGQRHSLGGFVGVAEYTGELGEFLPYLNIARWTGVGRQTVWGKGEIACETF